MSVDFNIAIIEKLKKGREADFKEIYLENRDIFFNYSRKFGMDDDDIKDVYQDSFIVFIQNIKNGKITELTSSISTYLIGIGKNKFFEKSRKDSKQVLNEDVLQFNLEPETMVTESEENDLLNERQLLIKEHLKDLGKKCRELLTLFYYESLTIKEILEYSEYKNENVVKSQKSRCLKALREKILT